MKKFALILALDLATRASARELAQIEVEEFVDIAQDLRAKASEDGSAKILYVVIGRGLAPVDTLLELAGEQVQLLPISVRNASFEMTSTEITAAIDEVLVKRLPAEKIKAFDKIVLMDYRSSGSTLDWVNQRTARHLEALGRGDIRYDVMAVEGVSVSYTFLMLPKHSDRPRDMTKADLLREILEAREKALAPREGRQNLREDALKQGLKNSRSIQIRVDNNGLVGATIAGNANYDYARFTVNHDRDTLFYIDKDNPTYPAMRKSLVEDELLMRRMRDPKARGRVRSSARGLYWRDEQDIKKWLTDHERTRAEERERVALMEAERSRTAELSKTPAVAERAGGFCRVLRFFGLSQ